MNKIKINNLIIFWDFSDDLRCIFKFGYFRIILCTGTLIINGTNVRLEEG